MAKQPNITAIVGPRGLEDAIRIFKRRVNNDGVFGELKARKMNVGKRARRVAKLKEAKAKNARARKRLKYNQ